ncbi:hypothetical protein GYN67_04655 [Lactococcus piscium]|uniref:LytTR family transcriptional regulator DNA-binding domain-containing protein n=1 Tax=Pseudolactococcus carnosus TaxID=2749961 RepID=UPI001FBAE428|nr:LytTR family transcriptional regulator DNA-binding domain-containing protein [Lactococcus carnosus]MCJ1995970.1 hypothetical protein [Lactococcus carnosus]
MKKIVALVDDEILNEICKILRNEERDFISFTSYDSVEEIAKLQIDFPCQHFILLQAESIADFLRFETILTHNRGNVIGILSHNVKLNELIIENGDQFLLSVGVDNSTSIKDVIQRTINLVFFSKSYYVEVNGVKFNPDEVLFTESSREYRNCIVLYEHEEILVRQPLKNFSKLRHNLIRIDRSLIVNINKIKSIDICTGNIQFYGSSRTTYVSEKHIHNLVTLLK